MNIEDIFYIPAEIVSIRRKTLTINHLRHERIIEVHYIIFEYVFVQKSYKFFLLIFSFTFWFQFCCRSSTLFETLTLTSLSGGGEVHLSCDYPQYIFLAGVLSFISVSVFLKLAAGIKFLLMASMLAIYVVVMEITHRRIFESFDNQQE